MSITNHQTAVATNVVLLASVNDFILAAGKDYQ